MRSSRSVLLRSLAATAVLGLSLATASPAMASGSTLLRDGFEGNIPLTLPDGDTDPNNNPPNPDATPIFGGVSPAGAPWVLDDDSEVRVRKDGRIKIELDDLVIPGRTPGNPAPLHFASLLCGGKVVASTPPFEVDPEGDGEFEGKIRVPKKCKDPQVLIRNAAGTQGYFAFTDDHKDHHKGKHHATGKHHHR